MVRQFIVSIVDRLGYSLIKKSAGPAVCSSLADEKISEVVQRVRPYTMLSPERLMSLYDQAVFCEKHDIPGCFVECGVWKGGAVATMALANMEFSAGRRHIHLFDSFQDICEPDRSVDGERAVREAAKWASGTGDGSLRPLKGFYDAFGGPGTLEGNRDLLERKIGYAPDYLHYHQGWFQDTLPGDAASIGETAILRLDGDWYASTKICLDYLYDKVVSGGFVIIDDYGAYDGCRKAVDEFMEQRRIAAYLNHIDAEARYWIKP
ncbi:MAG: hypothetical protein FIA94_00150 [Nitrospirae bacterium]|nr:hypothetical protein [Nitrospirota bacterium]